MLAAFPPRLCPRCRCGTGLANISRHAGGKRAPETHRAYATKMVDWTMGSQGDLVKHLRSGGWLKTDRCIAAITAVDRKNYIAAFSDAWEAYEDSPLPIGCGETISAPHMHATALEVLHTQLQPGHSVLDVGSGSGYLAACMAYMVQPGGHVLGLEKHQELANNSLVNIKKADGELLKSGVLEIRSGNALGELDADVDNYNSIHIGAAADEIPQRLCQLLKPGGLMLVPVGPTSQTQMLTLVLRTQTGEFEVQELMPVRYVPLTRPGE